MKLTIIKDDGAVYKDNKPYYKLPLSTIPSDVHALQWNNGKGHIEFIDNVKANEEITELPLWANNALTTWQSAYDTEQADIAQAEAKRLAEKQVQVSQ